MIVIPGSASRELGIRISELLGARIVPMEFKRFPDGESYIRFNGTVDDEDVAIVQTTSPPQNENLIQVLLMADNAKAMGARTITTVVPYFAYARQDKAFRIGEAFSAKTIIKLFRACGVDRIITVNSHNPNALKTGNLQIQNLSAVSLLANYFKKTGVRSAFSLSLGKKGLAMASEAHTILSGEYGYISTRRDRLTGNVNIEKKSLPISDRDVIIFDDIISSGGTMVKAVAYVKEQNAKKAYVACVHPLLIGDAYDRIVKSGADGIVGTDTISSPVSVVSVASLIVQALKN